MKHKIKVKILKEYIEEIEVDLPYCFEIEKGHPADPPYIRQVCCVDERMKLTTLTLRKPNRKITEYSFEKSEAVEHDLNRGREISKNDFESEKTLFIKAIQNK